MYVPIRRVLLTFASVATLQIVFFFEKAFVLDSLASFYDILCVPCNEREYWTGSIVTPHGTLVAGKCR